jgi:alpha-beta hydrolase superfamily lysophospholipase
MSKWDDAATWIGEGLRREVFYFGPEEASLYGSLYSAQRPTRRDGVVVCASWGYEADRTERLAHRIALAMARAGGAGMVFHYPGYGDSHGASLAEATVESLAQAAAGAIEEASQRRSGLDWFPAGLMLGASVAALAQQRCRYAASRLLFVQPALSPSAYFAALAKSAQRVTLGPGRIKEMSFAYSLPRKIVSAGPQADAPVRQALAAFAGEGTVVRYVGPPPDPPVPERFAELTVEGTWRFGMLDSPALERGVAEWLGA